MEKDNQNQVYMGMLKKVERKVDNLEILLVELLNKDNPGKYKVSENNIVAYPPGRLKPISKKPDINLFNFSNPDDLPF